MSAFPRILLKNRGAALGNLCGIVGRNQAGGFPMKTQIVLEALPTHTRHVPLAVLGYCLTRTGFLKPVWEEIEWSMKTIQHTPTEKLQDMLVSILAGNEAVCQINTQLRPDLTLAAAWNRKQFAEQSSVANTLDVLGAQQTAQLRMGSQQLFRQHSQTMSHDFEKQWLTIDIDPTGLLASRKAEGSRKGYISGQRNQYGRQLARLSVPTYHESLYSVLYPGNQQAAPTLKPAITTAQEFLSLSREQRQRTIIRSDASLGTDGNINWLLWSDYQVLMKGFSGNRAVSYAKKLNEADWQADPSRKRWIAWAPAPRRFARRVRVFALRWRGKNKMRYGTLLSTLFQLEPLPTWRLHDGRGAIEIEIKADKQGLRIPKRRKKSFAAQEGLILLTDLAHNILSWVHHWVLEDSSFADFATKRIVDELMCIPGRVELMGGKLRKVALLETHPYAHDMRLILEELLDLFENP